MYICALSPGLLRRRQFSKAYMLRRVYSVGSDAHTGFQSVRRRIWQFSKWTVTHWLVFKSAYAALSGCAKGTATWDDATVIQYIFTPVNVWLPLSNFRTLKRSLINPVRKKVLSRGRLRFREYQRPTHIRHTENPAGHCHFREWSTSNISTCQIFAIRQEIFCTFEQSLIMPVRQTV